MSRPYKRVCASCNKPFKSSSNGRINCYDCSPPSAAGRSSGRDLPGGQVGKDKLTTRDPETEVDQMIRNVLDSVDNIEANARAAPTKYQIGNNSGGDRVVMAQRPENGWGKCRFMDPDIFQETCSKERFCETTPFCYHHIDHWRAVRAARVSKRIAAEGQADKFIKATTYDVKTPEDAVRLLAEVAKAVEHGNLSTVKADSITKIVDAQLKALAHGRDKRRLELMEKRMKAREGAAAPAGGQEDALTPEEEQELKELDKEYNVGGENKDGSESSKPGS